MNILGIHGMNVSDGGVGSIGKLQQPVEAAGHKFRLFSYGHFGLWKTRAKRHEAVRALKAHLDWADMLVSHSFGAVVENLALESEEHWEKKFLSFRIAPAANRNLRVPDNIESMVVMHSRGDFWVWLSGFRPFHQFGWMGHSGYKGPELGKRVRNLNWTYVYPDHSDPFHSDVIDYTSEELLHFADKRR